MINCDHTLESGPYLVDIAEDGQCGRPGRVVLGPPTDEEQSSNQPNNHDTKCNGGRLDGERQVRRKRRHRRHDGRHDE